MYIISQVCITLYIVCAYYCGGRHLVKHYQGNIMRISAEYEEYIIRRISGGGMELGESSRYLGCDLAHKDFCNLGGTNRRLDLG